MRFFYGGGGGGGASQASLDVIAGTNIKVNYGALGNGRFLSDLATTNTSTTVTSATANFTSADVGRVVCVEGAGTSGAPLTATISSITNTTTVVVGTAASATLSGKRGIVASDDTTAFQNAINAIDAAGGGVIFIPSGIYLINGAFNTAPSGVKSGYGIGQLVLPTRNLSTQPEISIAFQGQVPPAPNTNWTTETPPLSTGGSIICSYKSGAQPYYGIFNGGPPTAAVWLLSGICVTFRNLTFRTYNNPNITPLNLGDIGQVLLENILVDNGNILANVSQPTNLSFGIIMPRINNWCIARALNIDVIGYNVGILWSEHGDLDDVRVWLCSKGFQIGAANHGSRAKHLLAVGCTTVLEFITVSGSSFHRMHINGLFVEHTVFGDWRDTTTDISDANNIGLGHIMFAAVRSSVGLESNCIVSGAAYVLVVNLNDNPQTTTTIDRVNTPYSSPMRMFMGINGHVWTTKYATLAVNRHPVTGVFDDTAYPAAQINMESAVSDASIGFYTHNLNNTTPIIALTIDKNQNSTFSGYVWANGIIAGSNFRSGSGTPQSVITAPVGTIYVNTAGGANTTLYIKESGTGNTGWVAK